MQCSLGNEFAIWTGCYCTQWDRVAVMVCVALNGYHGKATYSWLYNNKEIQGENEPVLYTKCSGFCKAVVTIPSGEVWMQMFEVTGIFFHTK